MPDRRIDGILDAIAPRTERHRRAADPLGVERRHIARAARRDDVPVGDMREAVRTRRRRAGRPPCVSTIRRKRSSPAPEAIRAADLPLGIDAIAGHLSQHQHPGGELDGDLEQILGPASLQHLDALDDLERVADGAAERRVPSS